MIKFKRLDTDLDEIAPFLKQSEIAFCDLSLGVKYMWRDDFIIDYAIIDQTLIIKESCPDYIDAFYYPIGKNVDKALREIEKHCKEQFKPLQFCCIDNKTAGILCSLYFNARVYNDRAWSDYIYLAESFKTYSGKKLSGQRNHVNKFKREYPNYKKVIIDGNLRDRIVEFLHEYERGTDFSVWSEAQEQKKVIDLIDNLERLNNFGLALEVDGKIIGFSVGEVVGDTLIVHVEKALKGYSGVYPTLAQEFAKEFVTDKIKFINREEDCGDMGLRISKLQYHPLEVKEKNIVVINTLIDKISDTVCLKTEQLTISRITREDSESYYELYTDDELNKWWGYDYREDLGEQAPSPEYFYNFQKSLREKGEECSFAVRKNGVMVGELVLHNFDYFGGVEMGFRFFKKYQKKGYATISATALKEYVFNELGAKRLKSRCFKQNLASRALIERLGLILCSSDSEKFFFCLDK